MFAKLLASARVQASAFKAKSDERRIRKEVRITETSISAVGSGIEYSTKPSEVSSPAQALLAIARLNQESVRDSIPINRVEGDKFVPSNAVVAQAFSSLLYQRDKVLVGYSKYIYHLSFSFDNGYVIIPGLPIVINRWYILASYLKDGMAGVCSKRFDALRECVSVQSRALTDYISNGDKSGVLAQVNRKITDPGISVIKAGVGMGKTTILLQDLSDFIRMRAPTRYGHIWVLSQTNEAVANIVTRYPGKSYWVRSNKSKLSVPANCEVYTRGEFIKKNIDIRCPIFSTVHHYLIVNATEQYVPTLLMVDEYALLMRAVEYFLYMTRSPRINVYGDPEQNEPYTPNDYYEQDINNSWLTTSFLSTDKSFGHYDSSRQRFFGNIMKKVYDAFYAPNDSLKPNGGESLSIEVSPLVDPDVSMDGTSFYCNSTLAFCKNVYRNKADSEKILVVTPYNAQRDRLSSMGVPVKTFRSVQGWEADTVIVDMFRWSPQFASFSSKSVLVAFTRAKSKIILSCRLTKHKHYTPWDDTYIDDGIRGMKSYFQTIIPPIPPQKTYSEFYMATKRRTNYIDALSALVVPYYLYSVAKLRLFGPDRDTKEWVVKLKSPPPTGSPDSGGGLNNHAALIDVDDFGPLTTDEEEETMKNAIINELSGIGAALDKIAPATQSEGDDENLYGFTDEELDKLLGGGGSGEEKGKENDEKEEELSDEGNFSCAGEEGSEDSVAGGIDPILASCKRLKPGSRQVPRKFRTNPIGAKCPNPKNLEK